MPELAAARLQTCDSRHGDTSSTNVRDRSTLDGLVPFVTVQEKTVDLSPVCDNRPRNWTALSVVLQSNAHLLISKDEGISQDRVRTESLSDSF